MSHAQGIAAGLTQFTHTFTACAEAAMADNNNSGRSWGHPVYGHTTSCMEKHLPY